MSDTKQHLIFPIKIEVLSPFHIGSGTEISAMGEYIPTSGKIIFPNYNSLMKTINKAGKLQDYIQIILDKGVGVKTFDVLKEWGIEPKDLVVDRELNLHRKSDITGKNDILHLHTKTGSNLISSNKVYVPGSSLKGVIRNALIFYHLKNNPTLLDTLKRKFTKALTEYDSKANIVRIWQDFEKNEIISINFANALRVADSEEVLDEHVSVEQVFRRSLNHENTDAFDYLMECIVPETEIHTTLSIYLPNLKSNLPDGLVWKNPEHLFQAINLFSQANLEFEGIQIQASKLDENIKKTILAQIKTLTDLIINAKNEYCIVRIGKGKTKLFQTILLALDKDLMYSILALFKKDDHEILAQSRVLTADSNEMLGWIKIIKREAEPPKNEALLSNEVSVLIPNQTELYAYFIDAKTAELYLNGNTIRVQMVNKFKKAMEVYSSIRVLVKQVKNNGEINQVELITD